MRRWNGWGDDSFHFPLPESAGALLERLIGPPWRPKDVSFEEAASRVPASRLGEHPLIRTEPAVRLSHAAGQSFPDWLGLRSGTVAAFPDAVAFPESVEEVERLLGLAKEIGAAIIPYGGGTSVVGHLTAAAEGRPTITVVMNRLNRLLELDQTGCLAAFQAGVAGPHLEAVLRARGFTLGHYPQSFEYSTLGGWVATRSSGQFSLGYGRIEDLFVGGEVVSPAGRLVIPDHPASAAGPDLRQMVLGSEGRLGLITRCSVKISPLPELEVFKGAFFPDPTAAMAAVREMAQADLFLTMIRLSLAEETETSLNLGGSGLGLNLLEKWLAVRGVGRDKCLLIYGAAGRRDRVRLALDGAGEIIRRHKGVGVGQPPGRQWLKNRFRLPYLRNTLWERGYGIDTLETALPWPAVARAVGAIETALREASSRWDERIHVFSHLSHVYPHGSSIYTTYIFRLAEDPDETLARWRALKSAASLAVVAVGGTISHQHGVGLDHKPYLAAEKGRLGLAAIGSVAARFDPDGIMNPGKLID